MINNKIVFALIFTSLASLAVASSRCPYQATAQPKKPTNGCPYADVIKSAIPARPKYDKCPLYQIFAKCPFNDFLKTKSVAGDGKCAFTEFIKLRQPVINAGSHKCPFYALTSQCPLYQQLKEKLTNGGVMSKCPYYQKLSTCPILKEMVSNKSWNAPGKCAFAEYVKTIQPSGSVNHKCPFYELLRKCPLYQRTKAPSVTGTGSCPFYSVSEAATVANSKCPLFQTIKTIGTHQHKTPEPEKKPSPSALCPVYKVFGKCPVNKIIKSAVRQDGKCAFVDYVKTIQPTGGNFSKCPYYELAKKCPLFKNVIANLSRASLAKCPYYQKFAKCPLSEFIRSNKHLAAEGKCPFAEYMKLKKPNGGEQGGCSFYELFHKCPLYQTIKSGLSKLGDGKCPIAGIMEAMKRFQSNCPVFKNFKLITLRSHLEKCPYYGLFRKCPLSNMIKTATRGDGKCAVIEYIKSLQASGGSNSKCNFYELVSRCPLYGKLKSVLSSTSSAAANCPFYKLYAKCPLSSLAKKNQEVAAGDKKCVFIELMNRVQPAGGPVSKCPFYELFGKCPLYSLIANGSYVSGDGRCVFSDYVKKESSRPLTSREVKTLKESWKFLKRRSDLAPKIFLEYFKEKPESQTVFPELANLTLIDLPASRDFLHRVYTCFASLNRMIAHAGERYAAVGKCPGRVSPLRGKYSQVDIELFGRVFLDEIKAELGDDYTSTVEEAWTKALSAAKAYLSHP